VRPVRQPGEVSWRGAALESPGVELALIADARLVGGAELEVRRRDPARVRWLRREGEGGRNRVDRPRVARLREVSGRVVAPDGEGMRPISGCAQGRRART